MLADLISTIKTKHIIWGAAVMVGFVLLITGFAGGFVLIHNSNEAVTGYSQKTNVTESAKNPLSLGKNAWKLVFLGAGDYHIELSSGNKKTLYQPSIGMFSFQNLDVSLKNQKQSQSLGFQNTDCLASSPDEPQLSFFSCNKSIDNNRTISLTQDGYTFKDIPSGNTVVPYLGGLLQVDDFSDVEAKSGVLSASRYNNNSVVLSDKNTEFEATFDNPVLITDKADNKNSRFAYYDTQSKKLYLFKHLHDKPKELDMTKYAKQKDGFLFSFYLQGGDLYALNSMGFEEGLGFGDDEPVKKEDVDGQGLYIFNFNSPAEPIETKLPSDLVIERFVAHNGRVVFSASTLEKSKPGIYVLPKNKKDVDRSFHAQTLDMCMNQGKFYYLSASNAVYEYDFIKRSSYLIYESQTHNPVNLNCTNGIVSFPAQTKEGGESDYTWTSLTPHPLHANQTRTEDVFPIIDDTAYRISYAYIFKNTIYITLYGNGVCGEVDQETKTATLNHLKDLGLHLDDFSIVMRYDC